MTNVIQIANSQLNAGAYVDLQSTTFNESLKRLFRSEPVVGQYPAITSDGEYDIAESDQLGVENPIIPIMGAIDTEDFTTNAALHLTTGITVITLGYLKALWRVRGSSVTTLKVYFGADGTKTLKNWNGTSDILTVQIDSIDIKPREDSEGNHMIMYSLNLKEIKP